MEEVYDLLKEHDPNSMTFDLVALKNGKEIRLDLVYHPIKT